MNRVRVLAVDDGNNHLAAMKRALRRSYYDVITCTNPNQGLQLAASLAPDLILLGVCMPGMSGHEFLQRLRRTEATGHSGRETPVIFLSGLGTPHQRVTGLNAGAEDYVTKPYDPEELRARIRLQLRRRRPVHQHLARPAMIGPIHKVWLSASSPS